MNDVETMSVKEFLSELDARERDFVVPAGEYGELERVSLTRPLYDRLREIAWMYQELID